MKKKCNRRDFIKSSSLSAAGLSMLSYPPLAKAISPSRDKSTVVVCKDEECIEWPSQNIDQDRVQDMVDHTIMTLMGESDRSKAYEKLFPQKPTTSTKVLIHYNTMKPRNTRQAVTGALKKGLGSMLGNTFPEENVRIIDREGSANTSEKVKITPSLQYTIKDLWVEYDYFINCPHCWAMTSSLGGVTMNLKGMITSVGGQRLDRFHSHTVSDTPWMPILNSHPVFRNKQILCLINAITYSIKTANSGVPDAATYTLFGSKDMVASEYMGLQLLKEKNLPQSNQNTANRVLELAAGEPYNLGTNDPNNMNIVNISPPWNTQIITSGHKTAHTPQIRVERSAVATKFVHLKANNSNKTIVVYSVRGRKIWAKQSSENMLVWNNCDNRGSRVTSGMYIYEIRIGDVFERGTVSVK